MTRRTPSQIIRDILGATRPGDRFGPNEAALEARLFEKAAVGLLDFHVTFGPKARTMTREELAAVALSRLDAPATDRIRVPHREQPAMTVYP